MRPASNSVMKPWTRTLVLLAWTRVALAAATAWAEPPSPPADPGLCAEPVDVHSFQFLTDKSGDVNYYTLVDTPEGSYIHSAYKPSYETGVVGYAIPEKLRRSVAKIRWRWRALALPNGGNECQKGKGDSAAVLYLTWKRGLRWYVLKYVWSSVGPKGEVCDKKRNPFRAQDTVIVESGGPLNEWRAVEIDPDLEFRDHFEDGDKEASVPELGGIGLMSDGDQTKSPSEADFGGFVITYRVDGKR